jgi:hypothetical protein
VTAYLSCDPAITTPIYIHPNSALFRKVCICCTSSETALISEYGFILIFVVWCGVTGVVQDPTAPLPEFIIYGELITNEVPHYHKLGSAAHTVSNINES